MLTVEQLVELLKAERKNLVAVRQMYEEEGKTRTKFYHYLEQESVSINSFIWLLTDEEYASEMYNLFCGGDSNG